MTHELTATLGTIASRCVRVKLTPWPDEAIAHTLERMGYAAGAWGRCCRGAAAILARL